MDLKSVEKVLPRLGYGITASEILSWLNNFDEIDKPQLFSLLKVFEFISYNELLFRYESLFTDFLDKQYDPFNDRILIIPYGEFGKSATMMTYPLKKTKAFERIKKNVVIEKDYARIVEYSVSDFQHIIFIDDFVGSGRTFVKECKKTINKGKFSSLEEWINENEFKSSVLLSCIMMNEGYDYIKKNLENILIFSDFRDKIFDSDNSPLDFYEEKEKVKALVKKYDTNKDYNLGFENSQAVVSFFYGPPNNTLGLFWKDFKLFHRFTDDKLSSIRNFRNEMQFYTLFLERAIEKNNNLFKVQTNIEVSDFLFWAVLFLKEDKYPDMVIISLLSITQSELSSVVKDSSRCGYLDANFDLTIKGEALLSEVKISSAKQNFRKTNTENLQYTQDKVYLPHQINGKVQ